MNTVKSMTFGLQVNKLALVPYLQFGDPAVTLGNDRDNRRQVVFTSFPWYGLRGKPSDRYRRRMSAEAISLHTAIFIPFLQGVEHAAIQVGAGRVAGRSHWLQCVCQRAPNAKRK